MKITDKRILAMIKMDQNKFKARLGWQDEEFSLLRCIEDEEIVIVGENGSGELIYDLSEKGIRKLEEHSRDVD